MPINKAILAKAGALALLLAGSQASAATDPERIIAISCGGCHAAKVQGLWTRISEQRKTPEGWQMTIARMQMVHKAQVLDPDGGESGQALRTLVKYLSDTQGLAPSETRDYRYILEQELNTIETHPSEQFAQMCARCHTGARVALQRRTEDEWRNLVHFHLGQWPATEYQMMGRDRDWLGTALNDMVPYLAESFPRDSDAWESWSESEWASPTGTWRLTGNMPGRGAFSGAMTVTGGEGDHYEVELSGKFLNGEELRGRGSAIVYTGYEWRGSLDIDGVRYRQVLALSEDGGLLSGRMFEREHSERGLRLQAVPESGDPRILAVQPASLRAGSERELRIAGRSLEGEISLGSRISILEVLERSASEIRLRVAADPDADEGSVEVSVGDASLDRGLAVYRDLDRVTVEPAYAVARVGGNGGSQPAVQALFDAVGWTDGPDGEPGTADDLRLGSVAAKWSVAPWDEIAARDEDVRFAGQMGRDTGVFTPAGAGPNPKRKYQTNNAGNLKVLAEVQQDGAILSGNGQLIVTVQRWNNPPIR